MIYINDFSGTITIPKTYSDEHSETYNVVVTSKLGNEIYFVPDGANISTNPLYYKFGVSPAKLEYGEYTYKLIGYPNVILEEGILVHSALKSGVINYNTEKEKIQYNG